MLAKVDFFRVEDHQQEIHARLLNWARWVSVRPGTHQHPMWRQGKSNTRQWHQPEPRESVDLIDGMRIEKAVSQLPDKHRESLRWWYVWKTSPNRAMRNLGVNADGLSLLVRTGRQMLLNRLQ